MSNPKAEKPKAESVKAPAVKVVESDAPGVPDVPDAPNVPVKPESPKIEDMPSYKYMETALQLLQSEGLMLIVDHSFRVVPIPKK